MDNGFNAIATANNEIRTIILDGKKYSPVNERILAFRKVHPTGAITATILDWSKEYCLIKAEASYINQNGERIILGTGHALKRRGSSEINWLHFVECCETAAIGRALGVAGYGIVDSVASVEEVLATHDNDITPSTTTSSATNAGIALFATKTQIALIEQLGCVAEILKEYGVPDLSELTIQQASEILTKYNH